MKNSSLYCIGLSGLLLLSACAGKNKKAEAPPSAATAVKSVPVTDLAVSAAPLIDEGFNDLASFRGREYKPHGGLKAVHFAFDKYDINEEMSAILVENAAWLKTHPAVDIRIAGHCDERGTTEYNLALGQYRANTVVAYYRALGVDEARLSAISYGKEQPLCSEASENCWQSNRRAETLVRLLPMN